MIDGDCSIHLIIGFEMDFKPVDKTIRDLLKSGHQFEIPRFQRAYSWERRHYAEFLRDIVSNLKIVDGKIIHDSYFVGTMLFIGNFLDAGKDKIKVVDGQQRLTTITILFSVLSDIFRKKGNDTLAELIFNYIMAKDDNGEAVRILMTKSNYPYFAYFIQDYTKRQKFEPTTEEEENIKLTYNYFYKELEEKKLRQTLKKNHGSDKVDNLHYVDMLKAIRDQVLNCSFISISTESNTQANRIFEILNAKGKRLDEVDLIKNRIFEVLIKEEPVDVAYDYWTRIRNKIEDLDGGVGIATFYRHFWSTVYKKSSSGSLYADFKSKIIPRTPEKYESFLKQMLTFADYYGQIINPDIKYYDNRQEYMWLVQSLKEMTETFSIVQVRVPLMALMHAKSIDVVGMHYYKKAINYLENFHFAFNVVVSDRGNKLDSIYSVFAIKLCKAQTKQEANKIIDEDLIEKLEPLFPPFNSFLEGFSKFAFAKGNQAYNVKTKYALKKLHAYYSRNDLFEQGYTVEHIVPENYVLKNCSIGNLILLENDLNREAGDLPYDEKRVIYAKSKSPWVAKFVTGYLKWDESMFETRARSMAATYYEKVFGRELPKE